MMDWIVYNFLSSAISLVAISAALILTVAFWKLNLLVGTQISRIGMGACLLSLGIWLIYGMLWCASILPMDIMQWVFQIYEIRILWTSLWVLTTASTATSLLCLAWILHRGIHPAPQIQ